MQQLRGKLPTKNISTHKVIGPVGGDVTPQPPASRHQGVKRSREDNAHIKNSSSCSSPPKKAKRDTVNLYDIPEYPGNRPPKKARREDTVNLYDIPEYTRRQGGDQ